MPDPITRKVSAISVEITTPVATDRILGIDDPTGSPAAAYITWENLQIHANRNSAAPDADEYSGSTVNLTAGENLTLGSVCYLKSDGKAWKADADALATSGALVIATAAISADAVGVFLEDGFIHLNTLAPGWTIGGLIYLSTSPGAMVQAAPSGANDVIQVLGVAFAADIIKFRPSLTMVEHV